MSRPDLIGIGDLDEELPRLRIRVLVRVAARHRKFQETVGVASG